MSLPHRCWLDVHTCLCTYSCMSLPPTLAACMHTCKYICMYMFMELYMYVATLTFAGCVYTCTYICMYMFMDMYMYAATPAFAGCMYTSIYIHVYVYVHMHICRYTVAKMHRILIFIGHIPQKSPLIGGSFAENDIQLKASYEPSQPCTLLFAVIASRKSIV